MTDCDYTSTNPLPKYAPTFLYLVPVVVHVIQNTSGDGNLSTAQVESQIEILNEDFRAIMGKPGSRGTDTMIQFYLATTDPNNQPTTGITRSTNNTWFRDSGRYWNTLAWDTNRYLNIYTNNGGGALGYVPDIPQSGTLVGSSSDRVVVLWSTFGRNGSYGPPFNLGRTATHEVGHYFGLEHTFSRQCDTSTTCNTAGDLICDTAAHTRSTSGCQDRNGCSSPDPIHNYMNYSDDSCMYRFSSEQARRMRCTIESWRPNLASTCPIAVANSRTAGSNPQSYVSTRPVLGDTWTATIDLRASGYTSALLFGSTGAANLPFGNGEFLLIDLSPSALSVQFPTSSGPVVTSQLPIPNDMSFCGIELFTQAVEFGGQAGLSLTNAQDLVVGVQ